ncbi:Peroxiredoxin [Mucilaginibacter pineti]|uniref:Peroxiredoxin n=1 Tax=Mucilaginibacter pineti TaxID=1391627 RepID=A0A1G7KVR6_9SPHI|nr:TlpA disulfide reductase family protein [Mucilaginibacter pineti]SDF41327.1 Peroxiredoxin [Mucilaginibacter pineti]
MLKIILLSCIAVCLINTAYAQKHFQVSVKLDSSINPKMIKYQYNDGKTLQFFPDTFNNNRKVVLQGTYYSTYASFNISYIDKNNDYYLSDFFIGDKNASIDFFYKPNPNQLLLYDRIDNARPIYDTVTNKTYRELTHFNSVENLAVYDFYRKNKEQLNTNDSLRKVYLQMIKLVDIRSMQFLKNYSDDYFSFWYFINNINKRAFRTDTAYLKEQLAYFKSTFPEKYTQSIEGIEFIKTCEGVINPLKTNEKAPPFTVKTIDGKSISLTNLKGKYVLLDFWATWCAPCMQEVPFIKDIRKNYTQNKLAIIGISQDRDFNRLKQVIKQHGMNWVHYYDKETEISRLYGIDEFPTLILLNDRGKIIYKSDHIKDDKVEIPKLLKGLI